MNFHDMPSRIDIVFLLMEIAFSLCILFNKVEINLIKSPILEISYIRILMNFRYQVLLTNIFNANVF